MSLFTVDLEGLVAEATTILDEASKQFVSGHRAESAVEEGQRFRHRGRPQHRTSRRRRALQAATGIGAR